MSWVEFQLRLEGYNRSQERENMRLRELTWHVYTAPHRDPKKLKKNINQFWPLEKGEKKVTDNQKEAYLEAWKEYQLKLKEKEDGKDGSASASKQ